MFRNDSAGLSRDFWICRPLANESESAIAYRAVPAFRYLANKMMAYLLEIAGCPDGHGVRPHSLKVTTISAQMTEVAKGHENPHPN